MIFLSSFLYYVTMDADSKNKRLKQDFPRHVDIAELQDQPFCPKNFRSATVKGQTNVLLTEILVKTV